MSSGSALDSRTYSNLQKKSTLIPKIDQKLSGKTKFTLQNKNSNQVKQENKSDVPPKALPSKSKVPPPPKTNKPVENVKKLDVVNVKKDKIPVATTASAYKKTKVTNSDNVTNANAKSALKKPQEKSAPSISVKDQVPLVKTIKMTKIPDNTSKKKISLPQKKVFPAKSDNVKKMEEKEVPLLDRKESLANIPKGLERPESKIKTFAEMHKKEKSQNSIESAPETRIAKLTEVTKKPASTEKISKIARSPRSTPTRIPTRPSSIERKLFQSKVSLKDEKSTENKENIIESKKSVSRSSSARSTPTTEKLIPSAGDKKPNIEISSSRGASPKSQRMQSMESIPEIRPKTPVKVETPENKQKSQEKVRGTSQNSQRKTSIEGISERVQKMTRPVTSIDLPPRKYIGNEKPKQVSMETVSETACPKTPKPAVYTKDRNITTSQPDVSFFTRKLTKNLSKDFINVKGMIAQKIASSLSVKSKSSAETIMAQQKKMNLSNASQAFSFDFHKRFKYVAFIGQIDEDEGALMNNFVFYQPPEEELLLYDAANCAATQAFMRFCGVNFTVEYRKNAEQMSPSGKVPFIRCGSLLISEFEPICAFIGSKTIDSSNNKDPEEATMKAFLSMVSGMMENAERFVCWYDETTLKEHSYPRYGAKYPFPLAYILNLKKKSEERRYLAAQGRSGKTFEEIFRDVDTCCKHLAQRLGNNKCFFGKKHSEIDALVYGHIYALANYKLSGPAKRLERIVRNNPNLVTFAKLIDDFYNLKKFRPDCLAEVYQRKKEIEPIVIDLNFREAGLVF